MGLIQSYNITNELQSVYYSQPILELLLKLLVVIKNTELPLQAICHKLLHPYETYNLKLYVLIY